MKFDAVYYGRAVFGYPLGRQIRDGYGGLPWIPVESHNSIRGMQERPNGQFGHMKRSPITGVRKTHKYVENHRASDYLVPYTSPGCTAMCLYCYLMCNCNKCAYLRLFVNREQMTGRGRGRYCYRTESGAEAQGYLRAEIQRVLGNVSILHIGWHDLPAV